MAARKDGQGAAGKLVKRTRKHESVGQPPGFDSPRPTTLKRDRPEGVKRRSDGVERHTGYWSFAEGFDSPRPTKV